MTVTDLDVTRFFMTIPEAVQLVIQAGAIGAAARCWCSTWANPCGSTMWPAASWPSPSATSRSSFTGLRPGEKLHEELFGEHEIDDRPCHKLIAHAAVPPLAFEAAVGHEDEAKEWMAANG